MGRGETHQDRYRQGRRLGCEDVGKGWKEEGTYYLWKLLWARAVLGTLYSLISSWQQLTTFIFELRSHVTFWRSYSCKWEKRRGLYQQSDFKALCTTLKAFILQLSLSYEHNLLTSLICKLQSFFWFFNWASCHQEAIEKVAILGSLRTWVPGGPRADSSC